MAINHVAISGNLTANPIKRGTAENPILKFSVAVSSRKKDGEKWVDVPNFFDCVLFGKRAASLATILCKGMKVAIDGELSWSKWEKDGKNHSKVEIIANEIVLMAAPKEEQKEAQKDENPW